MKERYLTKSRFKLAMECPTKLYYTDKVEYANHNLEDQFLLALAEGGFQVGELAKCYFPGGYDINTLDYGEALHQTNNLLKIDKTTIYGAAFRYKSLFIRADILIKNYDHIELIEVKSKSINKFSDSFKSRDGRIKSSWKPYLQDVAFQKYVISRALQGYTVSAYLMLADKNALCPEDGLNQKFKITRDQDGRKSITVSPTLSDKDLSDWILIKEDVNEYCDVIYCENYDFENGSLGFSDIINVYADSYANDRKICSRPSAICAACEYHANKQEKLQGLRSGFEECWKDTLGWTDKDFEELTVLDIWNFRKKNDFIGSGRIKMNEIAEKDISPHSDDKPGLSNSERQWLQVQKVQKKETTIWIDHENLYKEMNKWVYPLHFIDFETTMSAIPFNKGRHPYEGIAFQFSQL